VRVEWEENPGSPFDPAAVTGFSFGLSTDQSGRLEGALWVDDLSLLGTTPSVPQAAPTSPPSAQEEELSATKPMCIGSLLLPLMFILMAFTMRRQP